VKEEEKGKTGKDRTSGNTKAGSPENVKFHS